MTGTAVIKSRTERKIVTAEKNSKIEEKALKAILPVIEKTDFRLWDVCYEKEGAMWYLRILIDKEGGINSDECEEISGPINEIIDKQDFIKNIDILEVGSPGLTKKLRKPEHFKACIGERIRVTKRGEKGREFCVYGDLEGYDEKSGHILLKTDGETEDIDLSECVKVNSDL